MKKKKQRTVEIREGEKEIIEEMKDQRRRDAIKTKLEERIINIKMRR